MANSAFFSKMRAWASGEVGGIMAQAKAALLDRWLELTGELGSSLGDYQAAMDVRMEGGTLTLVLASEPKLAQLVEHGCAPYDMRDTLLRTSTKSIRTAKAGHLYLYVPLRKTTRTIVDLGGNVAYKAARALEAYAAGGGSQSLPAGMADKIQPFHATDPLAGLVRLPPAAPGAGSTYMTWRTISQAGRPWMNRGIQGRELMARVGAEAPEIIARLRMGG